jgi:hypothetical protein
MADVGDRYARLSDAKPRGGELRTRSTSQVRSLKRLSLVGVLLLVCGVVWIALIGTISPAPVVTLSPWPRKIEDGGDLVVYWSGGGKRLTQRDYLTLSCGPQNGPDDYLQRKNVTDRDATPNSIQFSGTLSMHGAWMFDVAHAQNSYAL